MTAVARRVAATTAALLITLAIAAMPASASHTTHSHNDHSHVHGTHVDDWDWVAHTTIGGVHTNTFYNVTHDYYVTNAF